MSDVLSDMRQAFRVLVKSPLFSIVAISTLALGIGLNAATFSAIHGLLLRPLGGVLEPERLVQVYRQWPGIDYGSNSIPHYQDVRDRSGEVFESTAAWFFTPMSLSAEGRNERLLGIVASANFFQTYGVGPALGRAFVPGVEDRGPGAHAVTVLGYSFFQARFAGDPRVIGRTIDINGHPFEVVGVAPPAFKGPMAVMDVPLYVPLMMQAEIMPGNNLLESRGNNMMSVVARLREGKTIEDARQMMDVMLLQLREELPDSYEGQRGTTLVYQSEAGIHPTFRSAQLGMSTVIMVVVSLLLLIACVNVANLFLARARERRREMGIRISLGAGRRRILQQLFTESLLFSLLAGISGAGLAVLVTRVLSRIRLPIDGPFSFDVEIDTTVLAFTTGVSIFADLVFGLAPALQAARSDLVTAVRGSSSGSRGRSRVSGALVVCQMALSLILLVASGLFLRALESATEIDPGMHEPNHLVMASMDPGLQGYPEAQTRLFYDRLVDALSAAPEVSAVGLTDTVPLGFNNHDRGIEIPGYEFAEGERKSLQFCVVTEGYLETTGVDLLEGRTFSRRDDGAGAPVIVVNRRFAERFWPNESALGKIVHTAGKDRQVIGVVQTGKYRSLGEEPTEFMYLPERELFSSGLTLVARTRSSPEAVLLRVREAVRAIDPNLPLFDVRTMQDHLGIALLPARLGGSVLGIFGLLGLALAAVGIYGVMTYSVAQRQRELGIRVALGADRRRVVGLVLREGLGLAFLGVFLGLAGAAGASQLVKGMLYNVPALDPVAFGAIPILLMLVAATAVYLPARRAARVEPMRVLKVD
jgi:putative ABC transport system permease protein